MAKYDDAWLQDQLLVRGCPTSDDYVDLLRRELAARAIIRRYLDLTPLNMIVRDQVAILNSDAAAFLAGEKEAEPPLTADEIINRLELRVDALERQVWRGKP